MSFRRSNNLGENIRGDTGAPAISTISTMSVSGPVVMESCGIDERYLSEKASKPPSKRRKARSWLRRWKDVALKHTWFTPLVILIILLSAYAVNPTPSNPMHSAIFLSYRREPKYQGEPVMYGKGKKDLAFVAFYTVLLSFTREFLMQKVIRPWAHHCGIHSKAKVVRFMEQVYTAIYFSVFGPFGLYVMSKTDIWYFNTTAMFEEFPHREHEAYFKAYYLLEASYWAQQAIVLVLQLEKPRKDFKELVWHHIITLSLIGLSYRFHFTHIGLAVYITHDISDLFLATSKTLNYLDSPLMAPFFTVFVLMWVYQRHYLNLKILWAVLTKFRTVGPFELNWETQQYKCWISQIITFVLLASLQAVNLFWLYLIFRVSKNYVFNVTIADERSDNEDEEEEEVPSKELSNGSFPNAGNNIHSFAAKQNFARENKSPQVLLNGELVNAPILRANGKKSH